MAVLLVESRDPFEHRRVLEHYDLAAALAREGESVTLFLVHNGVLPARPCAASARLTELAAAGVKVVADEASLRERAIPEARLAQGVAPALLDEIIDVLASGGKVLWL